MISNDHKHQARANFQFHQNEIAIWGIGCSALGLLYENIKKENPTQKFGYYDVKHGAENDLNDVILSFKNVELKINQKIETPQIIHFFNEADVLMINGNHQTASKMILILDGKKEFKPNDSHLEKTIAIFYTDETKKLAVDLNKINPNIELIKGANESTIIKFFKNFTQYLTPALNGLILTGGESTRMKQNKSLLVYHKKAQWLHLFDLLQEKCEQTYISCTEKSASLYAQKPIITDRLIGYGPLSGIISALLTFKNKAVLVLACDLPMINFETINQLIESRDPSKMATTFLNAESNFLEPLITIYEPKALAIMLTMLSQGYTCPRKMLMQNDIKIIHPQNSMTLKNINFPEEKDAVLDSLKKL